MFTTVSFGSLIELLRDSRLLGHALAAKPVTKLKLVMLDGSEISLAADQIRYLQIHCG